MKAGRGSEAVDAGRERLLRLSVSLAPDAGERGDTGLALTEVQFVALARMLAEIERANGAGAVSPCANR